MANETSTYTTVHQDRTQLDSIRMQELRKSNYEELLIEPGTCQVRRIDSNLEFCSNRERGVILRLYKEECSACQNADTEVPKLEEVLKFIYASTGERIDLFCAQPNSSESAFVVERLPGISEIVSNTRCLPSLVFLPKEDEKFQCTRTTMFTGEDRFFRLAAHLLKTYFPNWRNDEDSDNDHPRASVIGWEREHGIKIMGDTASSSSDSEQGDSPEPPPRSPTCQTPQDSLVSVISQHQETPRAVICVDRAGGNTMTEEPSGDYTWKRLELDENTAPESDTTLFVQTSVDEKKRRRSLSDFSNHSNNSGQEPGEEHCSKKQKLGIKHHPMFSRRNTNQDL